MSLFPYLQLQPIEPQEDGSVSELDQYEEDDIIDLYEEDNGELLEQKLDDLREFIHGSTPEDMPSE